MNLRLFSLLGCFLASSVIAQDTPLPAKEQFHLFLLVGQSNMAGRGVDIKLGDGVADLGGLFVIGTERHESRRIDNQLRGRSGRQGDPGLTKFFLSAEDDLIRIFSGDRMYKILDRLGPGDDLPLDSRMLTKTVEGAQKKDLDTFNARYKSKFNVDVKLYAPYVYDAVNVMVDAMVKAKSSDPKVYLPVLAKTTGHKGVTGTISFDPKGDIKNGALTLYTYKAGKRDAIAVVR
jgi:hypothetical protein